MKNALEAIHPFGTAKRVHLDTGIPQRTVERILDGSGKPSFDTLLCLLRVYPSLLLALSIPWAPVATAAVEEASMIAKLAEMPARRRKAVEAMRGGQ